MTSLPPAVRTRVLALAAERLGALAPDLVPVSLKAVARFTPAKRARLGAAALAAALDSEPVFRQGVAELARTTHPALAAALAAGETVPAAEPADVAAVAYLLRTPGWEQQVADVGQTLAAHAHGQVSAAHLDEVQRLTEQLTALRAQVRDEAATTRVARQQAQDELVVQRKRLREMGDRAGRAEQAQRAAEEVRDDAVRALESEQAAHASTVRRLREQLADAERAAEQARQAVREGAKGDQLRLRLLLDAVVGAAQGLRRELALPPAEGRPADALTTEAVADAPARQGRADDDPGLLDALLAVPTTHVLVDGYNVTKTAYPHLALEAQRGRLLTGMGALAARTGAEVTVVFDGADGAVPVKVAAPRGVRLVFSRTGETADEVLRRFVRHEPHGRPVVVVSSDKEVADGVRRSGARPVPALALVRLLERSVGGAS